MADWTADIKIHKSKCINVTCLSPGIDMVAQPIINQTYNIRNDPLAPKFKPSPWITTIIEHDKYFFLIHIIRYILDFFIEANYINGNSY